MLLKTHSKPGQKNLNCVPVDNLFMQHQLKDNLIVSNDCETSGNKMELQKAIMANSNLIKLLIWRYQFYGSKFSIIFLNIRESIKIADATVHNIRSDFFDIKGFCSLRSLYSRVFASQNALTIIIVSYFCNLEICSISLIAKYQRFVCGTVAAFSYCICSVTGDGLENTILFLDSYISINCLICNPEILLEQSQTE